MQALNPGTKAPHFELPTAEGERFSLAEALRRGPVLAAFFKVSCPVCHLTFPYIERIFAAYGNQGATIVGISQDPRDETLAFRRHYDLNFPLALDDTTRYAVSNAYGLTNVPTAFLIESDGTIATTMVGWSHADMEAFNAAAAKAAGREPVPLLRLDEDVPAFKPG